MTIYTIFGAGPGGLYTAWRLAWGGTLKAGDVIDLYEWGDYDFGEATGGTRLPAGRICTHHYKGDRNQSYVELGGMRYVEWDQDKAQGHQLVTKTIDKLVLTNFKAPFNTVDNPLFYLRRNNFYQQQLGCGVTAPYNTPASDQPADAIYSQVSKAITGLQSLGSRAAQCEFYATGKLPRHLSSFVYRPDDLAGNIGYWNFFYDQANNEGYEYASDAGGYTSNVIGWNAADAAIYNGEFAPGGAYMTLSGGYSMLFERLYSETKKWAQQRGIKFNFYPKTRLHSIWLEGSTIAYRLASAEKPFAPDDGAYATYAFLCMPPRSLELVACATRYSKFVTGYVDILNDQNVQNLLQSVILQPSYKIAMFFDSDWWTNSRYPPKLPNKTFVGPTITDLSLRQVYYFGDNAPKKSGTPVYGLLASYDDMQYTTFWQDMELSGTQRRTSPLSWDYQPLQGPRDAPAEMERMLLQELAAIHYGSRDEARNIPKPKQTSFMNWGLDPFGAGYHAWAAHFNIGAVMQQIRKPAPDANLFIIGSAFSNDQAWVEGAFCTAESVLVDFLKLPPFADTSKYPLICKSSAPDSAAAHAGLV
jgi:hypothetical protein